MQMTFSQYIQNPMGIKNMVFSARDMYRNMYVGKWDAIRLRENGVIDYKLFIAKDKSSYYCYMKIPSEVVPRFYYDVVVRFFIPDGSASTALSRSLEPYCVQFFSNDPNFTYTFAHAFIQQDMIIKDLIPRLSKESVKFVAKERNPKDEIGYDKAIFFLYLEMKNRGLFSKARYESENNIWDKVIMVKLIADAETVAEKRNKEGRKYAKKDIRKVARDKMAMDAAKKQLTGKSTTSSWVANNNKVIVPKSKISGKSKITGKAKIKPGRKSKI